MDTWNDILGDLANEAYYREPAVIIFNADCLDILPRLPNNSINLVVTSPPYDNLRDYKGYDFHYKKTTCFLYEVIKVGGVVVWIVGDATINGTETATSFKQALYFKEVGFNLHDTMIWEKSSIPQNSNRYEPMFEYMFVLSNGNPKVFNPIKEKKRYKDNRITKDVHRKKDGEFTIGKPSPNEMKLAGNIWNIPTGGGHNTKDKIAYKHPAIFPEKLVKDHIISWSNKENIIMDPFLGSGTTTKVAKNLGRKCIGIEIEKKYCDIAVERLKQEVLL